MIPCEGGPGRQPSVLSKECPQGGPAAGLCLLRHLLQGYPEHVRAAWRNDTEAWMITCIIPEGSLLYSNYTPTPPILIFQASTVHGTVAPEGVPASIPNPGNPIPLN